MVAPFGIEGAPFFIIALTSILKMPSGAKKYFFEAGEMTFFYVPWRHFFDGYCIIKIIELYESIFIERTESNGIQGQIFQRLCSLSCG